MLSNDARNMVESMVSAGKPNGRIARELGLTIGQVSGVRYRMKSNGHAANGDGRSIRMRKLWRTDREKMMGVVHAATEARLRKHAITKAKRERALAHWANPEKRAKHLAAMDAGLRAKYAPVRVPLLRRIASALGL